MIKCDPGSYSTGDQDICTPCPAGNAFVILFFVLGKKCPCLWRREILSLPLTQENAALVFFTGKYCPCLWQNKILSLPLAQGNTVLLEIGSRNFSAHSEVSLLEAEPNANNVKLGFNVLTEPKILRWNSYIWNLVWIWISGYLKSFVACHGGCKHGGLFQKMC